MLSGSALSAYQPHKLSRLPVREPPGSAGLAILDHYAATISGSYLKRTGRKRYNHGIPHCRRNSVFPE
jgi:hypothetical protein